METGGFSPGKRFVGSGHPAAGYPPAGGRSPDPLGAGVLFPLLCLSGALALLGLALWRLFRGGPWKHAALLALGLILPLAIFLGFFVLAGALGLGPVPS